MPELIIAGKGYPVAANVVNMYESGWDASIPNCISAGMATKCTSDKPFAAPNRHANRSSRRPGLGSNPSLSDVQKYVRQFVVHHDGLATSAQCFHVLQNERGLSCHFLIDNNGTIYQTLDLALCGFHASEFNPRSVGVELANRGKWEDTGDDGQYYVKRWPNLPADERHEYAECVVRRSKIRCFDFTKAQFRSMVDLARALNKYLPGIALDYPQDVPGHCSRETLPIASAFGFSGYIGHYHLTTRKWDPGPFDFKKMIETVRGSLCFPVWTGKAEQKPEDKPQIPEQIDELEARTDALYKQNEDKSDGGFFPVGPWGESRLFHGGVHLPQFGGGAPAPVWAPFPGRLVAARMGASSEIGSVNFVLLRHELSIGPQKLRFHSLYMHLLDEMSQPQALPPWMTKDSWKKDGKKGEVVILDEAVEAGEVIGRFGTAGPDDLSKKQIHFEIFSANPLHTGDEEDAKFWTAIDGSGTGRFSENPELIDPIDTSDNGILERDELIDFYTGSGDREGFRKFAVYSPSEWTDRPDWVESLSGKADFEADLIASLVEDQINPGLWWTEEVAQKLRLPRDGMVWHYHPLTFIQWFNEKLLQAQAMGIQDEFDTEGTGDMLEGDFSEDEEKQKNLDDSDMFNQAVANGEDPINDLIDLHHLVEGYNGFPETP